MYVFPLKLDTQFKELQLKYPTYSVLKCLPYLHLPKNIRVSYIRFPKGLFPNVTFSIKRYCFKHRSSSHKYHKSATSKVLS